MSPFKKSYLKKLRADLVRNAGGDISDEAWNKIIKEIEIPIDKKLREEMPKAIAFAMFEVAEKGDCIIEIDGVDIGSKIRQLRNKDSKTNLMKMRNAMNLLYSSDYYIWGIKNTQNRKEKKRTDILIINKETKKEFLIYNWKRVFNDKPKNSHCYHYEVYSDEELVIDGEFIVKDERKGRQSGLIDHLFKILKLRD